MADIDWSRIAIGNAFHSTRPGAAVGSIGQKIGSSSGRAVADQASEQSSGPLITAAKTVASTAISMIPGNNIASVGAEASGLTAHHDDSHPVGEYFTTTGVVAEGAKATSFVAEKAGLSSIAGSASTLGNIASAARGVAASGIAIVGEILLDPMTNQSTLNTANLERLAQYVPYTDTLNQNPRMQAFVNAHPAEMKDLIEARDKGDMPAIMDKLSKQPAAFHAGLMDAWKRPISQTLPSQRKPAGMTP
jgi:hypothetical protein